MRRDPTGAIVRTMRLSRKEELPNGGKVTVTISAPGIIVHLKPEVPGVKPSDVRRKFVRAAIAAGCAEPVVVERSHGHYAQSGTVIAEGLPSAYQVMGPAHALLAISKHAYVDSWGFAVSVRVPVTAGGNGPEKVRPASGTVFGKPDTVKRTGEVLAKQTFDRISAFRRAYAESHPEQAAD